MKMFEVNFKVCCTNIHETNENANNPAKLIILLWWSHMYDDDAYGFLTNIIENEEPIQVKICR